MLIVYAICAIIILKIAINILKKRNQKRIEQESIESQRKAAAEEAERQALIQKAADEREWKIQEAIEACPGSEVYRLEQQAVACDESKLNITEFTKIAKNRFVAFDLETTGLTPGEDEIVEIGAVRVENGIITERYEQLVNPGFEMPSRASAVNHITDDMLFDKPFIYEVLPSFLSFVGDDVLAAHNSDFDAGFLAQACMRYRFKFPETYFDTMKLARYWPSAENKKLVTLIAAAGIVRDKSHRALSDAEAVANLILVTNEKRKEGAKANNE